MQLRGAAIGSLRNDGPLPAPLRGFLADVLSVPDVNAALGIDRRTGRPNRHLEHIWPAQILNFHAIALGDLGKAARLTAKMLGYHNAKSLTQRCSRYRLHPEGTDKETLDKCVEAASAASAACHFFLELTNSSREIR
jgi:hypothetical protein